jgi:catechol 2,3-dioxygenase-like lactoylglutathione lyase family enzyme
MLCTMRLEFIYLPTKDLQSALALYRDGLGFDELWREGELTVGLGIEGSETALMVDAAAEPGAGPGPIFGVERVDRWPADRQEPLDVFMPPSDIPGGRLMGFRDPAGNQVYVMDQSTAE